MILELTKQNILNLTNESKRKNILAAWRSWGIWHKAPEIGLSVYRLDLPDGSFFTASWYEGDDFYPGGGTHNVNRPRFNLCNKGGKLKAGSKAESLLTDKLKELRKELLLFFLVLHRVNFWDGKFSELHEELLRTIREEDME